MLEANPQFQHDDYILQALIDVRQFSNESLEDIRSLVYDSISPLEHLEANVAYCTNDRRTYVDMLKQYYLADTTGNCQDSLISLLIGEEDISSVYELAFAYINKQDVSSLNYLLNNRPTPISNNPDEIPKWEQMRLLLPIIYSLTNDTIKLNGFDQSYLYSLAENDDNLAGMLAKNVRLQLDTSFQYQEPIYPADTQQTKSMLAKKQTKKPNPQDIIKIHPNPANDYVIVEYMNTTNAKNIELKVSDMQSRVQLKQILKKNSTINFVDVHNFMNGIYNFSIFVDGIQKTTNKIVIQH